MQLYMHNFFPYMLLHSYCSYQSLLYMRGNVRRCHVVHVVHQHMHWPLSIYRASLVRKQGVAAPYLPVTGIPCMAAASC